MQPDALKGGFADLPVQSATAFRSVLQAMARPGTIHQLPGALPGPSRLGGNRRLPFFLRQRYLTQGTLLTGKLNFRTTTTPRTRRNGSSRGEVQAEPRADVLVTSDRKTSSSSPRA